MITFAYVWLFILAALQFFGGGFNIAEEKVGAGFISFVLGAVSFIAGMGLVTSTL